MSLEPRLAGRLPAAAREHLRALDLELGDWLAERSGEPMLGLAACSAAAAEGLGHSCLRLADDGRPLDLPGFPPLDLAALAGSRWLGDGRQPTPLVRTAAGLYLWRMHALEGRVGAALAARCAPASGTLDTAALAADIDALFAGSDPRPTRWQRAALAAAAGRRLFLLAGGPGTGKTSTVVRLLALLLRRHAALGWPRQPRVVLAAPTGKAGQRLAEAVRAGRRQLVDRLDADWQPALAAIPDGDAATLHRLLGWSPLSGRCEHDAESPLAADIVVVDEASMVDLGMMAALLDALPATALLLLLGDPEQLSAVGAGSVLADLVAAAPADNAVDPDTAARLAALPGCFDDGAPDATGRGPLAGHTLRLDHVWRASGALLDLPAAARRGDAERFVALLVESPAGDRAPIGWSQPATATALAGCIDDWLAARRERIERCAAGELGPLSALATLRESVLLAALRDGPFGAAGLNATIERTLRRWLALDEHGPWYPGRPVIVTRNAPGLGLYNGDVGIALPGPHGLQVWFERSDGDGAATAHPVAPRLLPEHSSAWALTVHKSQGSEYDDVVLVLPPDPAHPLLSRQLLYTGITRARRRLQLWASEPALRAAVERRAERGSGLAARLEALHGDG